MKITSLKVLQNILKEGSFLSEAWQFVETELPEQTYEFYNTQKDFYTVVYMAILHKASSKSSFDEDAYTEVDNNFIDNPHSIASFLNSFWEIHLVNVNSLTDEPFKLTDTQLIKCLDKFYTLIIATEEINLSIDDFIADFTLSVDEDTYMLSLDDYANHEREVALNNTRGFGESILESAVVKPVQITPLKRTSEVVSIGSDVIAPIENLYDHEDYLNDDQELKKKRSRFTRYTPKHEPPLVLKAVSTNVFEESSVENIPLKEEVVLNELNYNVKTLTTVVDKLSKDKPTLAIKALSIEERALKIHQMLAILDKTIDKANVLMILRLNETFD
jgi:hypothetical protein